MPGAPRKTRGLGLGVIDAGMFQLVAMSEILEWIRGGAEVGAEDIGS